METAPTVHEVLRDSARALTIFKRGAANELEMFLKRGKPRLKCFATGKERPARPEEIIRHLTAYELTDDLHHALSRLDSEVRGSKTW